MKNKMNDDTMNDENMETMQRDAMLELRMLEMLEQINADRLARNSKLQGLSSILDPLFSV